MNVQTPADVVRTVGNSPAVLRAMIKAERDGSAIANGVRIYHVGYDRNAVEFSAATSTYKVVR